MATSAHTGRNTHKRIGYKIGGISQLGHPVRHGKLVLHDYAQRVRKARHERDHRKQREHHDDGQRVVFLLRLFHWFYKY